MFGKIFIHFNVFVVFYLQCLASIERACNNCGQIAFNVQQATEDRILDDARTLKTKVVESDSNCFVECSTDCRCMSFSVCGNTCHLNAGSRKLVKNSLKRKHGCRYYDFPSFEGTCDSLPNSPGICCLPESPLCYNGGTCVVSVTDSRRRFRCECPIGYYGNQCQVYKPKTCLDYWTGKLKPLSGRYTIVDMRNYSHKVFCDFDSENDIAWTLIESFDMAHEAYLRNRTVTENFPLNDTKLNWELFRLSLPVTINIKSRSTFWRATCSYSWYGVDFRDYIRVQLSVMNHLSFKSDSGNKCLFVDYFDVKGTKCEGCTQSVFQSSQTAFHLNPWISRVKHGCSFDTSKVERKCGHESYANLLGFYGQCFDPNY